MKHKPHISYLDLNCENDASEGAPEQMTRRVHDNFAISSNLDLLSEVKDSKFVNYETMYEISVGFLICYSLVAITVIATTPSCILKLSLKPQTHELFSAWVKSCNCFHMKSGIYNRDWCQRDQLGKIQSWKLINQHYFNFLYLLSDVIGQEIENSEANCRLVCVLKRDKLK